MLRVEAWKALTFRTMRELSTGTDREFYFALGHPILVPPRIRGSCLIQFSGSFIEETLENVAWWSIPDTGALSAGFLREDEISAPPTSWRNNQKSLKYFLDEIHRKEALRTSFLDREPILGANADLLTSRGINVPSSSAVDTGWWLYEVVLQRLDGGIRNDHIHSLHIPKTMSYPVRKFFDIDKKKIHHFNPHFGIESIRI